MADIQRHYKQKGLGFGNVEEQRVLRAEKQAESRKGRRAETFSKNRKVSPFAKSSNQTTDATQNKGQKDIVNDRLLMLQKWKAERDFRKRMEQIKKKPAFKVGVVHHSLYSPASKDEGITQIRGKICKTIKPKQESPPRRTTRATQKRLMAKATASGVFSVKNIKSKIKKENSPAVSPKKKITLAPENHIFKPPAGLPNIPLFGRVIPQNMTPTNGKKFLKHFSFQTSNSEIIKGGKPQIKLEPLTVKYNTECFTEVTRSDSEIVHRSENGTHNSSIETVQLKLSSDEHESPVASLKGSIDNVEDKSEHEKSLNTTPEAGGLIEEPVFFSPYIVTSRGKSSARKEQRTKRGWSSPRNEIPTKDTVMQSLNISVEEEERTAQYFKFILNREIDRLQALCNKWTEIKSDSGITEDAEYAIAQAIGQTELLMRKKFERFRSLVTDCETGKGQMLVTCKDLQGFWDMTYMEVKNCDSRFENLEKLRANGWIEEEQPTLKKPVIKKKLQPKKKAVSTKQSGIRAMILAARKERMVKKEDNIEVQTLGEGGGPVLRLHKSRKSIVNEKQSNNGTRMSTSFNTSIQKSTPINNTRHSLLRKAQLSEMSKKLKSPLAIMKISQKCKTPEVHLDDTISYVNSDQTPAKSILKKGEEPAEKETHGKITNKVIFNEHLELKEVPVNEELQNKLDLAAALSRIDSYDCEEEETTTELRAERKLLFDDDSSDESSNIQPFEEMHHDAKLLHQFNTSVADNKINRCSLKSPYKDKNIKDRFSEQKNKIVIPTISIISATPNHKYPTRKVNGRNRSDEHETHTRTLRNRTVISVDTPIKSRRSMPSRVRRSSKR